MKRFYILAALMLPFTILAQGIVTDWQRSLGGFNGEASGQWGKGICAGPGNTFVLAMWSSSGVGGYKSQPLCTDSVLTNDYWVVKCDSMGNKIWDYKYGSLGGDACENIIPTFDGGYLLSGISLGDGCDKSQSVHYSDYWLVKIDSMG